MTHITTKPYHLAAAIFLWIFIVAALLTLTSCIGMAKGAGCQNGFGGYGEKAHMIKGAKR